MRPGEGVDMAEFFGVTGSILRVDLTSGESSIEHPAPEFYRAYLGGGGFGTWYLLKETTPDTDPLSPENILTIAPGLATGGAVAGLSRCSVTALSPETGFVGDSQAGGNLGPYIRRAGLDGVVITGRSAKPVYLHVTDRAVEFHSAENLVGRTTLEVHDLLTAEYEGRKISVVQCGPAGERFVRFASLASDLHNAFGRTGMGAVFGSKNLRAVVVEPSGTVQYADPDSIRALGSSAAKKVAKEGAAETLKKYGTPGIVTGNALAGNFCTHNYSSGFMGDYKKLDGSEYAERLAGKGTTCYGCPVGCRKTIRSGAPYNVSDRMGGPEFETIGVFGSNLDIDDIEVVARANELCNLYGIDTITMGGLASFLAEAVEAGAVVPEIPGIAAFGFGRPEGLLDLIEKTARREGIGDVLAEGFGATIDRLGSVAEPLAVHVKGHGFAVHMPQVKPSMALLYAVSPIGADHMSSEHDWIAGDTGETARSLGIYTGDTSESYGPHKVRAIMYSQYLFAALDSLGLCMFIWGPGSLFAYSDLEVLIRGATGWDVSLWEILKAGERRITMMRLLNLRRGATTEDDELPEKMFKPLSGGSTEGRRVDREDFREMRETYYTMMGWSSSGVPTPGKVEELDLAWTLR